MMWLKLLLDLSGWHFYASDKIISYRIASYRFLFRFLSLYTLRSTM